MSWATVPKSSPLARTARAPGYFLLWMIPTLTARIGNASSQTSQVCPVWPWEVVLIVPLPKQTSQQHGGQLTQVDRRRELAERKRILDGDLVFHNANGHRLRVYQRPVIKHLGNGRVHKALVGFW